MSDTDDSTAYTPSETSSYESDDVEIPKSHEAFHRHTHEYESAVLEHTNGLILDKHVGQYVDATKVVCKINTLNDDESLGVRIEPGSNSGLCARTTAFVDQEKGQITPDSGITLGMHLVKIDEENVSTTEFDKIMALLFKGDKGVVKTLVFAVPKIVATVASRRKEEDHATLSREREQLRIEVIDYFEALGLKDKVLQVDIILDAYFEDDAQHELMSDLRLKYGDPQFSIPKSVVELLYKEQDTKKKDVEKQAIETKIDKGTQSKTNKSQQNNNSKLECALAYAEKKIIRSKTELGFIYSDSDSSSSIENDEMKNENSDESSKDFDQVVWQATHFFQRIQKPKTKEEVTYMAHWYRKKSNVYQLILDIHKLFATDYRNVIEKEAQQKKEKEAQQKKEKEQKEQKEQKDDSKIGGDESPVKLQFNWSEHIAHSGEKYYYNKKTGKSTWNIEEACGSESQSFLEFLTQNDLEKFHQALHDAGVTELEDLQYFSEYDLSHLGMTQIDVLRCQRNLQVYGITLLHNDDVSKNKDSNDEETRQMLKELEDFLLIHRLGNRFQSIKNAGIKSVKDLYNFDDDNLFNIGFTIIESKHLRRALRAWSYKQKIEKDDLTRMFIFAGLQHLEKIFREVGVVEIADLWELDEEDKKGMGLNDEDIKRLERAKEHYPKWIKLVSGMHTEANILSGDI